MKTLSFSLMLSALAGCSLFADGSINQTCDDLGTCGGISNGGIVFVEQEEDGDRWKVLLLDGYGDELDSWSGQGSIVGGVDYDEQSQTVHLSVDENIRVLQPDGTPKIIAGAFFPHALSIGGSTAFCNEGGVLFATNEEHTFDEANFPRIQSVLSSAAMTSLDNPIFAVLQHRPKVEQKMEPTILEVSKDGNDNLDMEDAITGFDSSTNRTHDAFLMNGAYASCSKTGATYKIDDLMAGDKDPDRYPQVNFGDIASCEYDAETDEVVLFSESNGIGWMDASGKIVRTKAGTDGYRIVNGSVW